MHFEILSEDQSGGRALDILVPKIIGGHHTVRVIGYKGVGRIPKKLNSKSDPRKRLLLDQARRLFRGYGKTQAGRSHYQEAVILVCDLDTRCLKTFQQELFDVLDACNPRPNAFFCIAIEESEAWLLGDIPAVKLAYPRARTAALNAYKNDSICGTWECLADAVYKGGATALSKKGWQTVGAEKFQWAEKISPHMDVTNNKSPSFADFRSRLLGLISTMG